MNIMKGTGTSEVIVLGLQPGELLLESIIKAIDQHDIRNGMVVSGIGTLKSCTMHYINHVEFPPSDSLFRLEGPLELLSVSGVIANKEPHLHVVVSCKDENVHGGHLEPGSEVAYLAEIVIIKADYLQMERVLDGKRKVKLLGPIEAMKAR